ncbi:MAG: DUF4468 domain-containing protein [Bacteroidales bacterium]|nr:DUF4468 domain-containing protein [Bacteroidales bacterium]MCF8402701.1 DUF4468 domain-containing protein [Bacteroidales bacterium]
MNFTKAYFTLVIIFQCVLSFAQEAKIPVDEDTGLITYQEVVQQEGDPQSFFNSAISWINEYYANPVDVTKTRNPETGVIKGLHRFRIVNTDEEGNQSDAGTIQYRFNLEFKDNRYRYTLYEFVLKQNSKIPVEKWINQSDAQSKSYLKQVDEFARGWITSLKKGMLPKVEKVDEW